MGLNKNIMKYCRIYWLLLSTVYMNPFLYSSDYTHSSDVIQSQNIPLQVTSSAHLFNSSSNEIKGQNRMNSPPVINSQYNDFQESYYASQNTAISSSEDNDSSWGLPPLNSSESDSSRCLLDELEAIFESEFPESEEDISENSYFSTSQFMISTLVEENSLDNTARETSNSTFSSMEKEALYEKMLKETQTQFEAAFNLQGQYHHYESFKVIFSKLLPNIKENYSCEYDRVQIYVYILRRLGYTIREIALLSQIDGYLSLGYLPPRAPSSFERIVQGLKLTDDQLTLVTNHISSHQNTNEYRLKPKIGWIYKQYKQIFTKRRTHSKLVSQMK